MPSPSHLSAASHGHLNQVDRFPRAQPMAAAPCRKGIAPESHGRVPFDNIRMWTRIASVMWDGGA